MRHQLAAFGGDDMPVGQVTEYQLTKSLQLLEAATATNSQPSLASAGYSIGELIKGSTPQHGVLSVASTAGSGTMTVTLRLWGLGNASGVWAPLGSGATAAT